MRLVTLTLFSAGFLALPSIHATPLEAQERYSCTADKLRSDNDIRLTHTGDHDDERIVETLLQRRGRCVHVALFGSVRLRDDLAGIAELPPGSRALFHEITPASDRRLEVERAGGALIHRFMIDGRDAPFDRDVERWYGALLLDLARRSGHGAEARVASLRARGGTDAVLREIGQLESDEARRHYYRALLRGSTTLSPRDVERVLTRALGDVQSNSTRRSLLVEAMQDGRQLSPAVLRHAMEAIRSDGDKTSVLVVAARLHLDGSNDATRRAFFEAARTIRSDGDMRRVLVTALRAAPDEAVAREVIASTAEIRSDGDKASVLLAVAGTGLLGRRNALRREYEAAAATIRSSGDRARVLRAVSP
ncbi:MAG: hypothetical protein H0X64_00235 [Gemmatimonadaceae bacterium]|nr:hypothetical protein [Gemmatimonadaceae bacterium]